MAVLETRTTFHANSLAATQTPANPASIDMVQRVTEMLASTGIDDALLEAIAANHLGKVVHANASMFGFQDVFLVLAVITLIAMIPAYFLRKPSAPVGAALGASAASAVEALPKTQTSNDAEAPAQSAPEAEIHSAPQPPDTAMPDIPRIASPAYRLLHRRFSQRIPPEDAVAPAGRRKSP